ncbi:hypothetical protein LFM09_47100 [Lentzea alba]|uniref:hypothetical protein n=1 Tax=Lentzea alba TaxID=2714351 RepID=UPI0039BF30E8
MSEGIVGVCVFRLAEHVLLLAYRVSELALQALAFFTSFTLCRVVDRFQIGQQEVSTQSAEDAFGVELADFSKDEVLAHVDGGRVVGVFVGTSTVVVRGVAAVVGGAMPGVADHAPTAVAQHASAQKVAALCRGVLLQAGAVS